MRLLHHPLPPSCPHPHHYHHLQQHLLLQCLLQDNKYPHHFLVLVPTLPSHVKKSWPLTLMLKLYPLPPQPPLPLLLSNNNNTICSRIPLHILRGGGRLLLPSNIIEPEHRPFYKVCKWFLHRLSWLWILLSLPNNTNTSINKNINNNCISSSSHSHYLWIQFCWMNNMTVGYGCRINGTVSIVNY